MENQAGKNMEHEMKNGFGVCRGIWACSGCMVWGIGAWIFMVEGSGLGGSGYLLCLAGGWWGMKKSLSKGW